MQVQQTNAKKAALPGPGTAPCSRMFYQADSGTKQWYELQAGASTVSFGFGLFFSFPILAA